VSISILGIFVADLCFFGDEIPVPGKTVLGKKYIIAQEVKVLIKQLQPLEQEVMSHLLRS